MGRPNARPIMHLGERVTHRLSSILRRAIPPRLRRLPHGDHHLLCPAPPPRLPHGDHHLLLRRSGDHLLHSWQLSDHVHLLLASHQIRPIHWPPTAEAVPLSPRRPPSFPPPPPRPLYPTTTNPPTLPTPNLDCGPPPPPPALIRRLMRRCPCRHAPPPARPRLHHYLRLGAPLPSPRI
jgi:hypothetical protein